MSSGARVCTRPLLASTRRKSKTIPKTPLVFVTGTAFTVLLLLYTSQLCIVLPVTGANLDANRLYEDLMMSYNRFVRPVQNDSDTLIVKLGLKLSQLIDVVSAPNKHKIFKLFTHTHTRSWLILHNNLQKYQFNLTESQIPNDDHNCLDGTRVDRLQAQMGPRWLQRHNKGE